MERRRGEALDEEGGGRTPQAASPLSSRERTTELQQGQHPLTCPPTAPSYHVHAYSEEDSAEEHHLHSPSKLCNR